MADDAPARADALARVFDAHRAAGCAIIRGARDMAAAGASADVVFAILVQKIAAGLMDAPTPDTFEDRALPAPDLAYAAPVLREEAKRLLAWADEIDAAAGGLLGMQPAGSAWEPVL